MDILRAYRRWKWRRLALLGPAFLVALGATAWLTFFSSGSAAVLMTCLSIAATLCTLVGYFIIQTLVCDGLHHRSNLEGARTLRRQLRPSGSMALISAIVVAILTITPRIFPEPKDEKRILTDQRWPQHREEPSARLSPPEPVPSDNARAGSSHTPLPAAVELPPPLPTPDAMPPEPPAPRPVLTLELTHLNLSEGDLSPPAPWPSPPSQAEQGGPVVDKPSDDEPRRPRFRPDLDDFQPVLGSTNRTRDALTRAQPDENDPDGWPSPEVRLDGMVLFGHDLGRAPGLNLSLDLPFSLNDSIEAGWLAMALPLHEASGHERTNTPDWHHLTLAYTRRLSGYSRHATFDLAVSVGLTVDFMGAVEGLQTADRDPKLAPYVGIDMAFWQKEAIGLLFHAGESIPVTMWGSSIGVTDLSAMIRLDLSENISLHAGYRMLLLRFKENRDLLPAGQSGGTLADTFTGPLVGMDFRF